MCPRTLAGYGELISSCIPFVVSDSCRAFTLSRNWSKSSSSLDSVTEKDGGLGRGGGVKLARVLRGEERLLTRDCLRTCQLAKEVAVHR